MLYIGFKSLIKGCYNQGAATEQLLFVDPPSNDQESPLLRMGNYCYIIFCCTCDWGLKKVSEVFNPSNNQPMGRGHVWIEF